jgi:hypothetical protein
MLSIFEQKEFERQPEKKLTLNRLQTVLGPQSMVAEEPTASVAVEERPRLPIATAPRLERKAAAPVAESVAMPVAVPPPAAPPSQDAIPQGLQEFADQFTRNFREVLVSTVKDIQAPIDEDRRKMETAFDFFTRTARDMEGLRAEVAGACQKVDLLAKALQELSHRLGKAEDAVNISTAAAHAIQDAQQSLEKRLELQAGVIRTMHNAVQSREEKLDKILTTFQALHNVGADRNSGRGLPDNL